MTSSRPYLLRALNEWILDNDATPHLVVDASVAGTVVPAEFVKDDQIILNIAPNAVHALVLGDDWITFRARFGGQPRDIQVPVTAVRAIYARENGEGMVFPPDGSEPPPEGGPDDGDSTPARGKPNLKLVR
ncbi:MAG: ClpXP protease specificity-enhancing factor [Chromatiales bacterium]|nr:ClpXP protease specificity-enhancing factor [Chromatiales bacterium]